MRRCRVQRNTSRASIAYYVACSATEKFVTDSMIIILKLIIDSNQNIIAHSQIANAGS